MIRLVNRGLGTLGWRLVRLRRGVEAAPARDVSPEEKAPFGMMLPTDYGPVIVNRHDINQTNALLETGRAYHDEDIRFLSRFLEGAPEGSVCLDVGANFGLFALAFARALRPARGVCHAFEAQRVIAAMAGGTAVLNGLENLVVHHLAIGDREGEIPIPRFDYDREMNFGSVEFGERQKEALSQERGAGTEKVRQTTIDRLGFTNVRLVKIDIEGMEEQALVGAKETIARDRPVLAIEWIKSDKAALVGLCKSFGYEVHDRGEDLICVHPSRKAEFGVPLELPRL